MESLLKRGRKLSSKQKNCLALSTLCILGINYYTPDIVYEKWPILGTVLAACIGIFYLARLFTVGYSTHCSTQLAICALTLAVCIMQLEEHVMDLSYREYSFVIYSNKLLDSVVPFFKCKDMDSCAFDHSNILTLNTVGLWLPLFNMLFIFQTNPLYALFIIGFALGHVAGLVGSAVCTLTYAPGMAGGVVLVLPSALWCAHRIIRYQFIGDNMLWVICLASCPWLYCCIAGLVFLVNMTHVLPAIVWPVAMLTASIGVPYVMGKTFGYSIECYHERVKMERRGGDPLDSEYEALL